MNRENKRRKYDKNYYMKNPAVESFKCKNCGWLIVSNGAGSNHRNHCPNCLHSKHVDNRPGDRAAGCGAVMEPIGVWTRSDGEWAIIHRCTYCGAMSSNRIAADDNPMKLMALALKPFAMDYFDKERLSSMLETMEDQGNLF